MRFTLRAFILLFVFLFVNVKIRAEEAATPYIDSLKRNLPAKESTEGFTEKIQSELDVKTSEGFTEEIRSGLPLESNPNGYSQRIQNRLEEKDAGGAIQAVNEGRSELELKRPGKFIGAVGFRFAFQTTSNVSTGGSNGTDRFDNMYGTKWDPDGQIFLEHRFFHDEQSVSLGASVTAGVAYRKTYGSFEFLPNRPGGGTYPSTSNTTFEFLTVPVSLGGTLRVNTLKYLRPHITGGPSLIYYNESRTDGVKGNQGYSYGALVTGGVNLMLDWISRSAAWDLYESAGVKHYYLSLDYSYLHTFSGDVNFSNSAIYAGITFEL